MSTDLQSHHTHTTAALTPLHLAGSQRQTPASVSNGFVSPAPPRAHESGELHLPLQPCQLRRMRCPNYVPVALRRTEHPPQWSPGPRPYAERNQEATDGPFGYAAEKVYSNGSALDQLAGDVTGPPTRKHWKSDASASVCDAPSCTTTFSFFERRHHCRKCGHIYCHEDTPYTVPLDQDARFHPEGSKSRACERCWNDYKNWETARCSRYNGQMSDSPPTPTMGISGVLNARDDVNGMGNAAGSVPRNWDWSTF